MQILKTISIAAAITLLPTLTACGNGKAAASSEDSDSLLDIRQYTSGTQVNSMISANPMLEDANGKRVRLKDILDSPTYVDVWATWCGPCRQEIPYFAALQQEMKDSGIKFISISCDENKEAWQALVKKEKPAWPQYILCGDGAGEFMSEMGIESIPRFMILGANGSIIDADAPRPSDPQTKFSLSSLNK